MLVDGVNWPIVCCQQQQQQQRRQDRTISRTHARTHSQVAFIIIIIKIKFRKTNKTAVKHASNRPN